VWAWFNKQTTNGNARGVTFSLLDRITSVTGFGEAMMFVGWIEQNDKELCMPKFDRHTSESAKTRALTNKRVDKLRNARTVTESLPEKRREEKNKDIRPSDVSVTVWDEYVAHRKAKKATVSNTVIESLRTDAKSVGLTIEQAIQMQLKRGWTGFDPSWVTAANQPSSAFAGAI